MLIALMIGVGLSSFVFAQSPGDTVGWTQYPIQALASTGHRIVVDGAGGAHFAWTGGSYPAERGVFYNFYFNGNFTWPGVGTRISYRIGDGYPQIGASRDNRAEIAFHRPTSGQESIFVAIDAFQGLGAFEFRHPPNVIGGTRTLWPFIAADSTEQIHVISTGEGLPGSLQALTYTRSNNGGTTWTQPVAVDTVTTASAVIVSSPVSEKVAIVYCHPVGAGQYANDVYYIQSADGITWDFADGRINLTGYGHNGDSLYAYTDIDAAYDYNDALVITWNARYVVGNRESDRVFLFYTNILWYYNAEICRVDVPRVRRCQTEAYNLALNKMSIAADQDRRMLYVAYCRFDTSDCSADSMANGEIYLQRSQDNGVTWSSPLNLTNSHTPNCTGPNCASDVYPSMAERVDDNIHLFYECYRYPNFVMPNADSPMLYLRLPAGEQGTGESTLPSGFSISQNYPNPFNAQTTIKYSLKEKTEITISIYNIVGEKLTTLLRETQPAGEHQAVWDASRFSSGIYFAKLESKGNSESIRMVLLK